MKIFKLFTGAEHFILEIAIPQDGEAFKITFAGIITRVGWYTSVKVGSGPVRGKRFNRTPGHWLYDHIVRRYRYVKIALNPFPVYAEWNNYWMVDHVEDWGVKRLRNGLSFLRWRERSYRDQDENRFWCALTDRSAYEEYERAVRREEETGYRQTSRDHGLEHFENHGW